MILFILVSFHFQPSLGERALPQFSPIPIQLSQALPCGAGPWKWGRRAGVASSGELTCVSQSTEEATTLMERMSLSHREKGIAHHGPSMGMQGMERDSRPPPPPTRSISLPAKPLLAPVAGQQGLNPAPLEQQSFC